MKVAISATGINQVAIPLEGLALQPTSLEVWDSKYRLKTIEGTPVEATPDETLRRVAHALAQVEKPKARAHWEARFLWALRHGALPAGRIISNVGAQEHKPKTTTINCTVSAHIRDSMKDILEMSMEAGLTLKSGAGIGYCFSTLRPRGAIVAGAGASTSGPLSFMDVFDRVCATVSSAGGRRGAQMATFDIAHPDVEEFITAKREHGRLSRFNLSLLITASFLEAVEGDQEWPLVFPVMAAEKSGIDLDDPEQVLWREWPIHEDGYTVREDGMVACKIYRKVPARDLWRQVMESTYNHAEPGFILIDTVNQMNNNWWAEDIISTNP